MEGGEEEIEGGGGERRGGAGEVGLLMMSKASQFSRVQAAVILRNSGAQIQALSVVSQDLIAALAL